jgi:hypothetical protein
MEFYFKNWVQLSYDFGKVVLSVTTQGKVCWTIILALAYPHQRSTCMKYFLRKSLLNSYSWTSLSSTTINMYEVLLICLNNTIAAPFHILSSIWKKQVIISSIMVKQQSLRLWIVLYILYSWSRWKHVTSASSPDTFVFPPWRKGQPWRILHYKESYTRASQINAGNAVDLGILPEPAQWPKSQFGAKALLQALPQCGMKG